MTTLPTTGILTSAPLTTTFTPAPSCTNDYYTNVESTYYSIGGPLPTQCFPDKWRSTSQYFSPGVCPVGYTQACSSTSTFGTETETFATCCPTGYACYTASLFNFLGQACASLFTTQRTTTVTDGQALTVLLATLHAKTEAVNGYGVSIRYNAKDFASETSSSSSSTSSISSSSSGSSSISSSTSVPAAGSQTSSTTASNTATGPSSVLSSGAKAGIGIGIAAVVVLAIIALGFFIINRRRAARRAPVHEADGAGITWVGEAKKPEKSAHEVYTLPSELPGNAYEHGR